MIISRYIVALLLATIYLLTVLSPLISAAAQMSLGQSSARRCSGDCKVDGCSLERSATHTCCCWQVAQQETDAPTSPATSDKPTEQTVESPMRGSCCGAGKISKAEKNNTGSNASTYNASQKKHVTYISSTPCGSGKTFVLPGFETSQHIPIFFKEDTASPVQSHLSFNQPKGLTSRYGEPPDPPPII